MNPRHLAAGLVLSAALTTAPASFAQGSAADQARNLAATCANCHGTNGRSAAAVPTIAGQTKADLLLKMNEYKDGKRPGTIMPQLAKGYTGAQIDAMAEWFAAQKAN